MSRVENDGKKKFNLKFAFLAATALAIGIPLFQNCSSPKFEGKPDAQNKNFGSHNNNGYGYNGKLQFIKVASSGTCPDENRVELSITVRLDQNPFPDVAFIERENCANIKPKVLKLGEQAILSSDRQTLTYKTETETVELIRDPNAGAPVVTNGPHMYVAPNGSDSNPGTQALPFLTIQKAADSAVPGTTVHVAPGTYAEKVVAKNGGTENARIRFVSDVKWAAKIRPLDVTTDLWLTTGDYVDLVGFEIDGSASPIVRRGVGLNGNHTSVQYNRVHHVALGTPCDNNGAAGIFAYGGNWAQIDEHIIGNTVHDIGTRLCRWQWAVSHSGTGSVINNMISNAQGGIGTWHDVHHVLIANNTLFNTEFGILVGAGDPYLTPAPADYMTVINNIIVYTNQIAIQEDAPTVGTHNIFANNLFHANNTNWALAPGRVSDNPVLADPLFLNYQPDGTGNYSLQQSSPAIDRGFLTNAPNLDIEGIPRGTPDLGAFESRP